MKPERHSEIERAFIDYTRYSADGFGELYFVGAKNCDRFAGEAVLDQRSANNAHNVLYCYGANRSWSEPDEREDGKRGKRLAEMIEHVIAAPVNNTRFENRVIQTRVPDQLLCRPFRLMVAAAASGSCPKEAHEENLPYPGHLGRFDHVARAFDMNTPVGLHSNLTIDPGAMRNGVAAIKRLAQLSEVVQTNGGEVNPGKLPHARVAPVTATRDQNHCVTLPA